ncbi:MAG: DsbC family protein [Gammaproteobacteria bacterium]|nr:DsbC family protein [Gammaproteobacteria bacterium]
MKLFRLFGFDLYWIIGVSMFWGLIGSPNAQEQLIRKNLQGWKPLIGEITKVQKSAIEGVFSIETDQQEVYYVDASAKYMVRGDLYEVATKHNLTEERRSQLLKVNWDSFPLGQAIKIVQGSGTRKLIVFSDPRCPYCKQLEQELQQLGDLTVYVFVVPMLGPESHKLAKKVVCAKDSGKFWLDMMLGKSALLEPEQIPLCDAGVLIEKNVRLARKLNIKGVPVLFFPDGTRSKGLMRAIEIDKILEQEKKERVG